MNLLASTFFLASAVLALVAPGALAQSGAPDPRAAAKVTYYANRIRDKANALPTSAAVWALLLAERNDLSALTDKRKLGLDETPAETSHRIAEIKAGLPHIAARYQQLQALEAGASERAEAETRRTNEVAQAQDWLKKVNAPRRR